MAAQSRVTKLKEVCNGTGAAAAGRLKEGIRGRCKRLCDASKESTNI